MNLSNSLKTPRRKASARISEPVVVVPYKNNTYLIGTLKYIAPYMGLSDSVCLKLSGDIDRHFQRKSDSGVPVPKVVSMFQPEIWADICRVLYKSKF